MGAFRFATGGLVLLLAASPAPASTCSPDSPEDIARRAEIAFIGTVDQVGRSDYRPSGRCWDSSWFKPECGGKHVTFTVREVLRGEIGDTVSVQSQDGCYCLGPYWTTGADYLVVARRHTDGKKTHVIADNVCGGTGKVADKQAEVEALRAPPARDRAGAD
jgi:hypothetical protein